VVQGAFVRAFLGWSRLAAELESSETAPGRGREAVLWQDDSRKPRDSRQGAGRGAVSMAKKIIRSKVLLAAYDQDGAIVEERELAYDDYYGGINGIVDSNAYRAEKGIRRMKGEIYGAKGNLQQTFEVQYSHDGSYVKSRAVHEDGTVIED
jgi:hypothetical protein